MLLPDSVEFIIVKKVKLYPQLVSILFTGVNILNPCNLLANWYGVYFFFYSYFRFCSLEDEPEERHAMNQSILYNHS